jgi:hypothetical protein
VAHVVVNFRDRNGKLGSVSTAGSSVFDACDNALKFFANDFWKGSKPTFETILEVHPVGDSRSFRVRVARVLEWQKRITGESRGPNSPAEKG